MEKENYPESPKEFAYFKDTIEAGDNKLFEIQLGSHPHKQINLVNGNITSVTGRKRQLVFLRTDAQINGRKE